MQSPHPGNQDKHLKRLALSTLLANTYFTFCPDYIEPLLLLSSHRATESHCVLFPIIFLPGGLILTLFPGQLFLACSDMQETSTLQEASCHHSPPQPHHSHFCWVQSHFLGSQNTMAWSKWVYSLFIYVIIRFNRKTEFLSIPISNVS